MQQQQQTWKQTLAPTRPLTMGEHTWETWKQPLAPTRPLRALTNLELRSSDDVMPVTHMKAWTWESRLSTCLLVLVRQ